jgi:1-acyl-sn-glycerol-3-phosphate acyltransferase
MKRKTLQGIFHFLLTHLGRVEFTGTENLPLEGGLIVTTNHMSWTDTLHLFINPARTDITAFVADKYEKVPVFNWILNTGQVIWIDREKADFTAFRLGVEAIKSGLALGIAPEGTRSPTAELQEGKPGTVLMAQKTNAPIVPVGIYGTEHYFSELLHLRRPRIRLNFGPAYHLPPLDRDNRDAHLKQMIDEVMCRIAALLPPKYWGVYKDHPRVKEIMTEMEN